MKRKAIESPEGTPVPAAADHNDPEYAFLSTYIKKAIGPRYRTNDLSKDDHMPPILRGNCMNRVILYRGSFNPPHLGHLNLLKHAFTECGEDWNVIGAIVFVLPDSSLDYKFGHTSGTLKFSRRQRGQLWREGLADINWAFPYAYKLDWDGFLDRLRYAIEGDGLQVEFVALMGGDYLTKVSGFTYHRASQHRVTTDISRQVDFHSSDSVTTPEALVGHHPWTRVSIGPPSFRKLAIDAELFRMSNRLKEMQLDKGASSLTYLGKQRRHMHASR